MLVLAGAHRRGRDTLPATLSSIGLMRHGGAYDDIGLAVNAGTYRVYRSEQLQGGPTATAAAA